MLTVTMKFATTKILACSLDYEDMNAQVDISLCCLRSIFLQLLHPRYDNIIYCVEKGIVLTVQFISLVVFVFICSFAGHWPQLIFHVDIH